MQIAHWFDLNQFTGDINLCRIMDLYFGWFKIEERKNPEDSKPFEWLRNLWNTEEYEEHKEENDNVKT